METNIILPSSRARTNFVVAFLLFLWAIILWVVLEGDPDNSLHTSALAWAFGASVSIFVTFVFGVVWDNTMLLKSNSVQLTKVNNP